jgi:hypothetical protein
VITRQGATALSAGMPFPGLRPYEERDAAWFFGRGRETNELLRRLRRVRFLAVVGPSGCGKSSVVQAGMLPAVRDGYLDAHWEIATFRPGDQPMANLNAAVSAFGASPSDDVRAALESGPMGLVSAIQSRKLAPDTHVLILVDQFEELFQFVQRKGDPAQDETKAFLKLLLSAAASDIVPVYVIMTMRLEWLNEAASYVGLAEAINEGIYLIPQMSRRQFQQAILGPIEAADGTVTSALLDRMLNDLEGRTDQLPILQHALMRMWERRTKDEPLDMPVYTDVGGFAKCLELHAEEIFEKEFDDTQKGAVEALFKSITQVFKGRKIRRPRPLHDMAACTGFSMEALVPILESLRKPGRSFLVTTPGALTRDSIIDISHEALMRQWTRLGEWVESDADLAAKIERLEGVAAEWNQGKRENTLLLYRGSVLATAETWKPRLEKDGVAMAFLQTSRKAEFWRTLLLKGSAGLAVVAVVLGLALWGAHRVQVAQQARVEEEHRAAQLEREVQLQTWKVQYIDRQLKTVSPDAAEKVHAALTRVGTTRIYIEYATDAQKEIAEAARAALGKQNFAAPATENVGPKAPSQSEVRYWHAEDADEAKWIASLVTPIIGQVVPKLVPDNPKNLVPVGQLELWIAASANPPQAPASKAP